MRNINTLFLSVMSVILMSSSLLSFATTSKEAKVHASILPGRILQGATKVPLVPKLSTNRTLTVRLDVTHKVQEIEDGIKMVVWTFGDEVPGPTIRVRQGDRIHFFMANRSRETIQLTSPMPHSMKFHMTEVNPPNKFRTIEPGQTIEFEFTGNDPGVFMYHCAIPSMFLRHIALGMYGTLIVEPKNGYPTKVDREYVLVQSEFYPSPQNNKKTGLRSLDMSSLFLKKAGIVAFNGRSFRHMKEPLNAKPGERIRLFVLNAGPNGTSNFHVVGTVFDKVWLEGNPRNELTGTQAVNLGTGNSAIIEFNIPEPGKYVMVDHEFGDANIGAMGLIDAS